MYASCPRLKYYLGRKYQREKYAHRHNVILGIIKALYNIVKTRPSYVNCWNINAIAMDPTLHDQYKGATIANLYFFLFLHLYNSKFRYQLDSFLLSQINRYIIPINLFTSLSNQNSSGIRKRRLRSDKFTRRSHSTPREKHVEVTLEQVLFSTLRPLCVPSTSSQPINMQITFNYMV